MFCQSKNEIVKIIFFRIIASNPAQRSGFSIWRVREVILIFLESLWSKWPGRAGGSGLVKNFSSGLQSQFDEDPRGDVGDPEARENAAEVK